MKKMPVFLAVLALYSCQSVDRYEYNAYYDSEQCELYIVNSDEYTTRMIWNSNTAFFSVHVCLLPENREICLEPNWPQK